MSFVRERENIEVGEFEPNHKMAGGTRVHWDWEWDTSIKYDFDLAKKKTECIPVTDLVRIYWK